MSERSHWTIRNEARKRGVTPEEYLRADSRGQFEFKACLLDGPFANQLMPVSKANPPREINIPYQRASGQFLAVYRPARDPMPDGELGYRLSEDIEVPTVTVPEIEGDENDEPAL